MPDDTHDLSGSSGLPELDSHVDPNEWTPAGPLKGSQLVTHYSDNGIARAPDKDLTIAVLQDDGTYYLKQPGLDLDGAFEVFELPAGRRYACSEDWSDCAAFAGDTVNLNYAVQGRPDATAPAVDEFPVSIFAPDALVDSNQLLQLRCAGSDTAAHAWIDGGEWGLPMNISFWPFDADSAGPMSAAGDRCYVDALEAPYPDTDERAEYYLRYSGELSPFLEGTDIYDEYPVTLAELEPRVRVNFRIDAPNLRAAAPRVHPRAAPVDFVAYVRAAILEDQLRVWGSWPAIAWIFSSLQGSAWSVDSEVGFPFPEHWSASISSTVYYEIPLTPLIRGSANSVNVRRRRDAPLDEYSSDLFDRDLAPCVTHSEIDGRDAQIPGFIRSASPTITWEPSDCQAEDGCSYRLEIVDVTDEDAIEGVFAVAQRSTHAVIPPGTLAKNRSYIFFLETRTANSRSLNGLNVNYESCVTASDQFAFSIDEDLLDR